MGDSQSKQIGDQFMGRIGDVLDDGPGRAYNRSLYRSPSGATRDAWRLGRNFNEGLISGGGLNSQQRSAMRSLGGIGQGYGQLASGNGLSRDQSGAMRGMQGLGGQYADLGDAYDPNSEAYKTLRQGISDDTLTSVAALGASSGRTGATSFNDGAARGLGNALAGLDYSNMQNNVNNQYRSLDSQQGVFGNVFGMGQQGVDNRFNALAGQRGIANDQFGMGQQGINNSWNAIGGIGQIGAARDADRLAQRLADFDLYNRRQNHEIDWLGRINNAMGGGAGDGANEAPWWQQLLGGAIGIGGRALGGGAMTFGPESLR
jgi:hypothetical protein